MADLIRQGAELIREIGAAKPSEGSIDFWWLGQNGIVAAGGGARIFIDLYLKEDPRRATPRPFAPEEVTVADLVLGTHDHGDHVDRTALPGVLTASHRSQLVVSKVTSARLQSEGYAARRMVGLDDGETVEIQGVRITAIKASHEFFDQDPLLGYPHLGFGIEMNGVRFFHAGDGIPWEGLCARLIDFRPDIIFIPINGRDGPRYRRNILGNFTFQEAVDLVGTVQPHLAVPMHYDMFPGNQARVEDFTEYLAAKYPRIAYWVGPAGLKVTAGPW